MVIILLKLDIKTVFSFFLEYLNKLVCYTCFQKYIFSIYMNYCLNEQESKQKQIFLLNIFLLNINFRSIFFYHYCQILIENQQMNQVWLWHHVIVWAWPTCSAPVQSCPSQAYRLDAQGWPPEDDSHGPGPASGHRCRHHRTPHRVSLATGRQTVSKRKWIRL